MRVPLVSAALLAAICIAPLSAQEPVGSIRGRIVDSTSQQPLAGVHVAFGNRSTVTQPDGAYVLTGLRVGAGSLTARLIGYGPVTQAITVAAGQTEVVDFAMAAQAISLSAMIVTGYGEQRAGNYTGAGSQVSDSEFNPGRIITPQQLIQAKVPGVQVVDNNEPGGGISLRIRGTTSINASSEPLYVLDGVPLNTGSGGGISAGRDALNFLNPADIASITVLRDASATAIYGANGSNGVVLITTRSAQRGGAQTGPVFEYSTSFSASSVTRTPDMLNAAQFRTAVQTYAPAYLTQLGTANTNWFDLVSRTGYGQDHNLSLTGAGATNSWRLSLGYLNQDGIIRGSTAQRLALGLSYSQRLFNNRVDVRGNLRGSRVADQFTPGGVLSNAAQMGPTQPVLDSTNILTGYYQWPNNSLTSADNPVEILALAKSRGTTYRSIGNVQVDWRLPVLNEALTAHLNLGYDVTQINSVTFNPSVLHAQQKNGYLGELYQNNNNQANRLLETYLTYNVPIASMLPGTLDLTGGYSWSGSYAQFTGLYERTLTTDQLADNGIPGAASVSNTSPIDESRLISFFGRANYNLGDKYLIALSLRRDGSSRFGQNNAWGMFPSAAFAWRLSQEPFLRNVSGLSDLKLRVSYGKTGNQAFGNYLQYASYVYGNPQAQVQLGNQFVTTIRPGARNPDLKWESTGSLDIGVDFGIRNQRISGALDWYDRKTSDMIFLVPVDPATNLSNFVTKNIGSMRNRGIELSLRTQVLNGGRHGLRWNADFTVARNVNTVLSINPADSVSQINVGLISGGVGNTVQVIKPGAAVNSFFLCRQAYNDTSASANFGKPLQGWYYNLAGDSVVNRCSDNRQTMNSPQPRLILGHSSYFTYGSWDFGFTLRAYLGNYVYNNVASATGDYRELFAGTSPYNLNASVLKTGFTQAQYLSDYYLEKASFLRMDNLSLGYTFNYRGQPMRVYTTVQNAFTITGYSGVDPTAGLNGIDNNIYPRSRTFIGGLTVRF